MYVQLPSWDNGGTDELASMRMYQFSAQSLIDNVATSVELVSMSYTAWPPTRCRGEVIKWKKFLKILDGSM